MMATDERFSAGAMVDACLRLYEIVREVGTPEMVMTCRLLLYQAGLQIADEVKAEKDGARRDEH
ncbi:hypothetical protein MKK70_12075 [Methylobacterium sp. E-041]|jgi:hypothetical protein|uniref:hypothetical protein n=1 Tax=unclassified Methylobacterium TaxID=2615210 RepID=UPI0011C7C0CC|nr:MULTISPECIES: hypothetical protein [unclassified Methylobacterium]MCJ2006538.1 hypothetical protein [Methylobacterium sp. J-092]MCJ2037575.1 hypothetical protein [Methylobacterium sp. J-059]MCJ2106100.1 hypothetical protein [Methylobacterium sp. E-041]MCJ2110913.1 hypothetical protein [Methylobacterium sp. E-025]TXM88485.1 hypothetical protein FV223_24435 [Methylobacterium sp. WL116]